MKNLKKFSQKDRYGNMISFEFEVPPMENQVPKFEDYFNHPGQPQGTDTVPAWLTPGERVMNAEAERIYGPVLAQMNDEGRAIQAAQGGTIPNYGPEPEYAAGGCKVKYAAKGSKVSCNCPECSRTVYAADGELIPYPEVPMQPGTLSTEIPTPYDPYTINARRLLVEHEGYKTKPYQDHLGNWTVGAGHKIVDKDTLAKLNKGESVEYQPEQLMGLFEKDYNTAYTGAKQNFKDFDSYPDELQHALLSMNYQLGNEGTSKFEKMRKALDEKDWDKAAYEAGNSKWAKQTPVRAAYLQSKLRQMKDAPLVTEMDIPMSDSDAPIIGANGEQYNIDTLTASTTPPVPQSGPVVPKPIQQTTEVNGEALKTELQSVEQNLLNLQEQAKDPKKAAELMPRISALREKRRELADQYDEWASSFGTKQVQTPQGFEDQRIVPDYTQGGSLGLPIPFASQGPQEPTVQLESPTGGNEKEREAILKGEVVKPKPVNVEEGKVDPLIQEEIKKKAKEIEDQFKDEPNPYTDGMDDEEAEAIASTVETKGGETGNNNPVLLDRAIDFFKNAFGSLYDEQELGRMVIMYLGSRAFGYPHGGSAKFAVKNYLQRTDAKKSAKISEIKDLVKSGDYTTASIEAYKQTGNINDLKKVTDLSDLKTEILVKATTGGEAPKIVEVTRGTDGKLRNIQTGDVVNPTGFTRYAGELHDTGEIQTNAVNYIKESDRSLFQKEIRNDDGKVIDKQTIVNPAGLVSAYSSRLRTLYGPRADIYLNDPEGRARLLAYAEAARNHYDRTGKEIRNYEGLMAAVDSPLYTIEAGMTAKDGSTINLDSYQILDENVNQYVSSYNSARPDQPITTGRAMLTSLNLFNKDTEDYSESERDWLVKLKQKAADETPSGMSEEMYFTTLYFKYLNEQ